MRKLRLIEFELCSIHLLDIDIFRDKYHQGFQINMLRDKNKLSTLCNEWVNRQNEKGNKKKTKRNHIKHWESPYLDSKNKTKIELELIKFDL